MADRKRSTASLLTGLFLVTGLVGFVAISAVISGALERLTPSQDYTVRFTLERGAPGVKPGSAVTMGGQPVGRVLGVDFALDGAGQATGVDVRVAVQERYTLFSDARFVLVRPLIGEGGDASIGIPTFLADAGYGDTQVAQVQQMLADGADMMDRAADIAARLDEDITAITADARSFSRTLRVTSEDVQRRWPEINEEVRAVLANLDEASQGIDRIIREGEGLVEDLRLAVEEARGPLQETIAGMQRVVERVEAEHLGVALDAMRDAGDAAADLASVAERADRLLAEESPGISRAVANARLASDQLRQASFEIRRNPWRLLTRPSTKELEGELVYDAARSHADAASDLRDAAAALEAVLGSADNPILPVDAEAGAELQADLREAMERYQAAQDRLMTLIDAE
jgi:ABC-type transporter Mla subunit MlaD